VFRPTSGPVDVPVLLFCPSTYSENKPMWRQHDTKNNLESKVAKNRKSLNLHSRSFLFFCHHSSRYFDWLCLAFQIYRNMIGLLFYNGTVLSWKYLYLNTMNPEPPVQKFVVWKKVSYAHQIKNTVYIKIDILHFNYSCDGKAELYSSLQCHMILQKSF